MTVDERLQAFRGASVLVSGGCGFIGSHLVERLVQWGASVTIIDNLQAGKRENLLAAEGGVRLVVGDVRDRRAVEELCSATCPQFAFHLAANASVPGSVADPAYDFETNCLGTFVLLDALRHHAPGARVVLASSGAVYGEPASLPILETHPLRPISPYGASKLAAETEARMFQAVYRLRVVMARLFNTYGTRMPRFVVLDFLRKLQRDPSVLEIQGTGQQVRDFNNVSDTVDGLLLLGAVGTPGEAYNVASGQSCTVTTLAHLIIDILGLAGKTRIRFTGESWKGDAQHWEVSIEKLRALGYRPRVPLPEGLAKLIASRSIDGCDGPKGRLQPSYRRTETLLVANDC